jgi:prepilin-type N-terminal cleavage/methylation domain-containing protein
MRVETQKTLHVTQKHEALVGQRGFTLIETAIALVVLMVGALAMSSLFVYAIQNNVGGGDRALAMAVAQQQLEQIRSVEFDDPSLNIGTTTRSPVTSGGRDYTVVKTITNETNGDGSLKNLKRITITVTPHGAGPNWVRTSVVLVSERSARSMGVYAAQ